MAQGDGGVTPELSCRLRARRLALNVQKFDCQDSMESPRLRRYWCVDQGAKVFIYNKRSLSRGTDPMSAVLTATVSRDSRDGVGDGPGAESQLH